MRLLTAVWEVRGTAFIRDNAAYSPLGGVAGFAGYGCGMRDFEGLQKKGSKSITARNVRSLCGGRKKAEYVIIFQGCRWAC